MSLVLPNTFESGDTLDHAKVNTNFTTLSGRFGSLDNSDISPDAAINITKLSASNQIIVISAVVRAADLSAGLPGSSTVLHAVPLPGDNGDTGWAPVDGHWVCTDTGAGTGVISLVWGEYNSSGSWTTAATIKSGITLSNAAAGNDANDGDIDVATTTLAFTTTPRSIAILGTTADATTLSAAGSFLTVSVSLQRVLQ